jgi:hypothetical protein
MFDKLYLKVACDVEVFFLSDTGFHSVWWKFVSDTCQKDLQGWLPVEYFVHFVRA